VVSNSEYKQWWESMDLDKSLIMQGMEGCGMSLWSAANTAWLIKHYHKSANLSYEEQMDRLSRRSRWRAENGIEDPVTEIG